VKVVHGCGGGLRGGGERRQIDIERTIQLWQPLSATLGPVAFAVARRFYLASHFPSAISAHHAPTTLSHRPYREATTESSAEPTTTDSATISANPARDEMLNPSRPNPAIARR